MSPTCSTRYLMYFSGFLVKGTLPYLAGHGGRWGPRPLPAPPQPKALLAGVPPSAAAACPDTNAQGTGSAPAPMIS